MNFPTSIIGVENKMNVDDVVLIAVTFQLSNQCKWNAHFHVIISQKCNRNLLMKIKIVVQKWKTISFVVLTELALLGIDCSPYLKIEDENVEDLQFDVQNVKHTRQHEILQEIDQLTKEEEKLKLIPDTNCEDDIFSNVQNPRTIDDNQRIQKILKINETLDNLINELKIIKRKGIE
ncbi:Hypothetical_protein [Hexamita inflata]|uniref:Hypothetical_protein n=1 Tax=Hexamita inflata TaxID=28002 RepID=A0AA86TFP5_9EUKA|nr:Hypothetical protein HINF_LOCUS4962 [Hexamita inflata]CAI9917319.1 Hypothetical protein HINF_LOCUS4964 [Hexamita inflata]CAI9931152.1 Hypothetical protein HINF_LOCUS18797 [Hexamita inflata]CAI9931154.1 Hypothetical protein HINF_LOCUS18799 [Hexamita inflata]